MMVTSRVKLVGWGGGETWKNQVLIMDYCIGIVRLWTKGHRVCFCLYMYTV
jgi:hypothetical protein